MSSMLSPLFNTSMYDSLSYALSNLKTLLLHSHSEYSIKTLEDSLIDYRGYPAYKFHWMIENGGSTPVGKNNSKDAEIIGAVVETEKGTYLVTLVENNVATVKYNSWNYCADGWDEISAQEASSKMNERFHRFLQNIQFDID